MNKLSSIFAPALLIVGLTTAGCSHQKSENHALNAADLDRYKAVLTAPPAHVPTTKTPDGAVAGNGDIGITLGGTPDSLCFYIGKNDFWRAYPVYPGGIALPGGLNLYAPSMAGATYEVEQLPGSAEIRGRFVKADTILGLTAWVAAKENLVVIELEANRPLELTSTLWAAEGNTSVSSKGNDGVSWVTRSFAGTPHLEWDSHIALAGAVVGDSWDLSDHLSLMPGEKKTIVVTAYSNHDTPDWREKAIAEARNTTAGTVARAKEDHQQWWDNFWAESSVSIGDEELERYYYMSQYLFASASRQGKFAPGIWGPFITRDEAAWGGDYHLNYNYQAPYWASYSSNHVHLTDNFDQPLLDYMDEGQRLARELLGCRGIYYPVGIGPKGLCTSKWPLTPEEMMAKYSTRENTIDNGYKFLGQKINAAFSAGNMLMRHYSTYDEDYARRIYPFLIGCADFWEDYLKEEDGRYVIEMDHFNEVMPNHRNKGQWRDKLGDFNSTLSLGLVRMLFKGVLDVSTFLDVDADRRARWNDILARLSAYPTAINGEGRLTLRNMERAPEGVEPSPAGLNRVSIHGLIVPGGVAGPVTDSLFNAILLSDVNHWTEKMRNPDDWGHTLNNGLETCYPGAVRVGYDPDSLLNHLRKRIAVNVLPNLWIPQGGGGIETLAAVPLTINEMLLQSYEGVIRLFPNWVKERDASFDRLRSYGAFLVSSSLRDGVVTDVEILSEKGRPCIIENPWAGSEVRVWRDGKKAETLTGTRLNLATSPGEHLRLSPV